MGRLILMRSVLAPAFTRLINLGKDAVFGDGSSGNVLKALDEAEKFLNDYKALYTILSSCFYQEKQTGALIEYIESCFKELEKNFLDLRNVLGRNSLIELNPVIHKIEESSGRLASAMRELKDFEKNEDIESPMPVVNACIKAAYNVAHGAGDVSTIERWLPMIVNLINNIEAEIKRFSEIHADEEKIRGSAEKLIQDMREGTGALYIFIKDKKPVCLADGLRLLKYSSSNLYIILSEMDRIAKMTAVFSKNPALEEFYHSYNKWKEGKTDYIVLISSLNSLRLLAKLYDDIHSGMKSFPLFFAIENSWVAAQINKIQFQSFFSSFLNAVESKQTDIDLNMLKTHYENYSKIIERLISNMETEIKKVSGAPHLEELKELIGRVLNNSIIIEYFAHRVQFFAENHRDITSEFNRAKDAPGSNPVIKEVYELLNMQGEGLNLILKYLQDFDRKNLYDGLSLMEKALPRLIEIRKEVKITIDEKIGSQKSPKPICIKCGTENLPQAKKCIKCSAVLHFSVPSGQEYETVGMYEGSPFNIAKIEAVVQGFESGTIKANDVEKEIRTYLDKLKGISGDFEGRAKATFSASNNSGIREISQSFSKNLALMRQALETMLMFHQSPDFLYQGMQAFQAAVSEMSDLRQIARGIN